MISQIPHYNKTRIAPTPSGFLHLGNILSFALTASLAHKSGGKILLRIDDMDRARAEQQYIDDIFETLEFLDIPWHEGPCNSKDFTDNYSQLHRMNLYNQALDKLKHQKLVFACTCSRKQLTSAQACKCMTNALPLDTENSSWRLITTYAPLAIRDYNGNSIHTMLPQDMLNFIVRKKDGFPSYQLTSLIDDIYYGIDLVVRGQDLWLSTLAQHYLAKSLDQDGFNNIAFYHHPLLMETDGRKLSKSAGSTSIRYLRQCGKNAADIYTIIARMTGKNKKILNWQQLAEIMQ